MTYYLKTLLSLDIGILGLFQRSSAYLLVALYSLLTTCKPTLDCLLFPRMLQDVISLYLSLKQILFLETSTLSSPLSESLLTNQDSSQLLPPF